MAKTSKWFVVATEGATTDGREIQRNWIEEMAESYNPKETYGARINLDHIKFSMYFEDLPNSMCFGDVIAVKAEEREDGKLQLLAQIQPNDNLIELNKKGQKVYTSVEIDTNFADTGKAYLVGLAVTDSPASLGTEMLQFSAGRKLKADNIFTTAIETALEFEEQEEPKAEVSVLAKIKAIFSGKAKKDDFRFEEQEKGLIFISEISNQLAEKLAQLEQKNEHLKTEQKAFSEKLEKIENVIGKISLEPSKDYTPRPKATGESQSDGRFF